MELFPTIDPPTRFPVNDDFPRTCGSLGGADIPSPWSTKEVQIKTDPIFDEDDCLGDPTHNHMRFKSQRYIFNGPSEDLILHEQPAPFDSKTCASPPLPQHLYSPQFPWPSTTFHERYSSPDTSSSVSFGTCPSEGVSSVEMEPHYPGSSYQGRKQNEQSYRDYLTYQSFGSGYSREGGNFVTPGQLQQYPDPNMSQAPSNQPAEIKAEPDYTDMEIDHPGHHGYSEHLADDPNIDAAGETDDDAPMELEGEQDDSDPDYLPTDKLKAKKPRRRSSASGSPGGRKSSKRLSASSKGSNSSKNSAGGGKKATGVKKRAKSTGKAEPSPTSSSAPLSPTGANRAFPCPFTRYQCQAGFASKNEWKRHVTTQHLRFGFWSCDLCPPEGHSVFNRKDLYTQHLRRMHMSPSSPSTIQFSHSGIHSSGSFSGGSGVGSPVVSPNQYIPTLPSGFPPVTEDTFYIHQNRCYRRLRDPPSQSRCLFCDQNFSGITSWDERMEHVGRHLDQWRRAGETPPAVERWRDDPDLEQWLLAQGLLYPTSDGAWKITDGSNKGRHAESG
jgi:hypothetical protein